jgi:hypothetical protein
VHHHNVITSNLRQICHSVATETTSLGS